MNIYPRVYSIDKRGSGSVINFQWSAPGYSTWGLWCIAKFLSHKLDVKIINKVQSPFESQYVLSLDDAEISVYQEDGEGIDILSINEGGEEQIQKIIGVLNASFLFNLQST